MNINELTKLTTIRILFDIKDNEELKPGTKSFLEAMVEKKYEDNETIVMYGEEAEDGMYVIVQGEADVFSKDNEIIGHLQEGDIIGELALINDETRAATVKACGNTICANITRTLFEEITIANRKIIGSFLSMLYKRNERLSEEKEHLRYTSEHDQLTGLYNKGKYLSTVKDIVPNLDSIGIINMDVNNLKKINDTMGHEAGDRLIIKAANSIKAVTNKKIMGFRMGGDEFVIIGCNVTETQIYNIKSTWEEELNRLNLVDDGINCIIASGLVFANKPFSFDELAKKADELMYEDKKLKKASIGAVDEQR